MKGEIDKEIYCLSKINSTTTKELALHYDLTIPIARFVSENFSKLSFPFKRYQIQKVWRGERPQFGRYREFYQADIDVIDSEALPHYYDAEVLVVGVSSMLSLNIPEFKVGVSNRKIYEGYLKGIGVKDTVPVLRIIDKLDKISLEGIQKLLVDSCQLEKAQAEQCTALAKVEYQAYSTPELIKYLNVDHELFVQGLTELTQLNSNIELMADPMVRSRIHTDFSFVRGFDYYTGSIFEGKFTDGSGYGSICSGGRYDNLLEGYGTKKLPGVGFSIGLTRILAKLEEKASGLVDFPKYSSDFCLVLEGEESLQRKILHLGAELKNENFSVNVISVTKLKKGLQISARLGSAVTVFEFDGKLVFKRMSDGLQMEVSFDESIVEKARTFIEN